MPESLPASVVAASMAERSTALSDSIRPSWSGATAPVASGRAPPASTRQGTSTTASSSSPGTAVRLRTLRISVARSSPAAARMMASAIRS
ncbi:hypothetical protein SANTM175S_07883 [Streptomyces antimycoticus]